jgi:hypothetical protein
MNLPLSVSIPYTFFEDNERLGVLVHIHKILLKLFLQ